MSFRESLIEYKSSSKLFNEHYKWIIETIDEIIKQMDRDEILEARQRLSKSKHPFWKNQIMIKNITKEYEAKL